MGTRLELASFLVAASSFLVTKEEPTTKMEMQMYETGATHVPRRLGREQGECKLSLIDLMLER